MSRIIRKIIDDTIQWYVIAFLLPFLVIVLAGILAAFGGAIEVHISI
jgi:hypothetical protein